MRTYRIRALLACGLAVTLVAAACAHQPLVQRATTRPANTYATICDGVVFGLHVSRAALVLLELELALTGDCAGMCDATHPLLHRHLGRLGLPKPPPGGPMRA